MAIVSVIVLILSLLCAHGSSIAHLPRRLRPVCSKFALTGPLTEPESRQSLVDGTYHNNNSDSTMPASVHLSLKTVNISSEDRPGSSQFVSEFYEKNTGTTVLACSGDRLSLEHFCVHISGRNFSDDMQLQYRKVLSSLKLNHQSDSVRDLSLTLQVRIVPSDTQLSEYLKLWEDGRYMTTSRSIKDDWKQKDPSRPEVSLPELLEASNLRISVRN